MAGRIGIITGLAFEAALASKVSKQMNWGTDAPEVRCVGMGGAGAAAAAKELAGLGVRGLVSFGVAGGLDPALKAGTLVVPERVTNPAGGIWTAEPDWRAGVLRRIKGRLVTAEGLLLAGAGVLGTAAAKQAARRKTGAVATDMESAQVARAAQAEGLQFLAVRAVADEAGMVLPPAASAMGEGGTLRPGALIGSLIRQPAQIPNLIDLGLKTRAANRTLEETLRRVGPGAP